jgi:hypothetical protein
MADPRSGPVPQAAVQPTLFEWESRTDLDEKAKEIEDFNMLALNWGRSYTRNECNLATCRNSGASPTPHRHVQNIYKVTIETAKLPFPYDGKVDINGTSIIAGAESADPVYDNEGAVHERGTIHLRKIFVLSQTEGVTVHSTTFDAQKAFYHNAPKGTVFGQPHIFGLKSRNPFFDIKGIIPSPCSSL